MAFNFLYDVIDTRADETFERTYIENATLFDIAEHFDITAREVLMAHKRGKKIKNRFAIKKAMINTQSQKTDSNGKFTDFEFREEWSKTLKKLGV